MARFHYNASALALGGQFRRAGTTTTISGVGAMILPNTGGQSSSEVLNFDYGGVSFARASSAATGRLVAATPSEGAHYRTELFMRIEDLNVLGTVHAERLALQIVSLHPAPIPPVATQGLGEDGVRILVGPESGFGALRVRGTPLKVSDRLADFAQRLGTFGAILRDEKKRGRDVSGRTTIDTCLIAGATGEPTSGLAFHDNLTKQRAGDERASYISIPGFGRLFLGEVLADGHTRRINLLRIELDPSEGRRTPGPRGSRAKKDDVDRNAEAAAGDILGPAGIINGSSYP